MNLALPATCFALALQLAVTPAIVAQPAAIAIADADKEAGWIDHFDGVSITGWEIFGPVVKQPDGTILLGGSDMTRLRLTAPLGEHFKLRLELKVAGASPMIAIVRQGLFEGGGGTFSMPGPRNEWCDYLFWNAPAEGIRTQLHMFQAAPLATSESVISAGNVPIRQFELIFPAGAPVHLRKLRLQTTPPPESTGLVVPFVALGAVLASIMALGWFLQRRRTRRSTP